MFLITLTDENYQVFLQRVEHSSVGEGCSSGLDEPRGCTPPSDCSEIRLGS